MPVKINPRGTPLRDGHPLKGGCVIFGWNRPPSSAKPSTPTAGPSTSLPPFEIEAHRAMEDSLHRLYEQQTGKQWTEPSPPSESTTPDSPESASIKK